MNKVSSKLKQIFLSRHYVLTDESIIDKKTQSYYFTYLLNRFGIEIVNPEKLNMQVVKDDFLLRPQNHNFILLYLVLKFPYLQLFRHHLFSLM